MKTRIIEKTLFMTVFAMLGLLSLWLQFGVIEPPVKHFDGDQRHDPDYYIENFTAIGMDKEGRRKYVIEAERMVHYPDDDTALLDNPHIIQYKPNEAPLHSYSESGWMNSDGDEVLLTGNVRVIQGRAPAGYNPEDSSDGGVMTTEKLRLLLDEDIKEYE